MAGNQSERSSFPASSENELKPNHKPINPYSIPTNPQNSSHNPFLGSVSDADSAYNSEPSDCFPAVLKYINDMLMEEDLGDKPCMLRDSLALQAAEKSFYDILGQKHPPSSSHFPPCLDQNIEIQNENFTQTRSVDSSNSYTDSNNLAESNWISGKGELESSLLQSSHIYSPQNTFMIPNLHREIQPFCQLNGMMRSASNTLHSMNFSLMRKPPGLNQEVVAAQSAEKDGRYDSLNRTRVRRNHLHEADGYLEEGRSNKHSMVSESEELEQVDDAFLNQILKKKDPPCPLYDESRNELSKKLQQNEQIQASDMDLLPLLTSCAQAVGIGDQRTASELLKQIRERSSPFGDANQRLAHYFANGLEARLNGTGILFSRLVVGHSATVADILKAQQLSASIFPFRKMTNRCANITIAKLAEKERRIHIIDFGIGYGFQWACFLYRLSTRPGGPPRIRITGIELPQPGFWPAERVEETGCRLKRMAERLNVPFQFNAIAQIWETIRYEDLKINRDEVIAVNCMYRLKNLPDDTTVLNSARDTVLKLIKRINPEIFLHGVSNGSYNASFFGTRFREALFHYSAMFEMFEANAAREDQERIVFEREMIGREVINVIACEGTERIERPETYKLWQNRNLRIGFRQLPLHQDILKRVRNVKPNYHKDFIVDEDGHWLLLGWKGRILHAISVWKHVQK